MSFVESQSKEYQTCLEALRNVTATLEHQQNSRIIPKQYQPKLLKTSKPTLMEEFQQKCNDLFFQQLEKGNYQQHYRTKILGIQACQYPYANRA